MLCTRLCFKNLLKYFHPAFTCPGPRPLKFSSEGLHLPPPERSGELRGISQHRRPRASASMFIPGRNSPRIRVRLQQRVDAIHDPAEQSAVQGLGHGVADVGGLVHSVGADDGLSSGDHTLGGQSLLELLRADAEEGRR